MENIRELKESLDLLPRKYFFHEERYDRWGLSKRQPPSHRYDNPHNSWFPVSFDENGVVLNEEITKQYIAYENIATIQKVVKVALEWMGKELSWHHNTLQMSMSIMQHYRLKKGETTKAIPWHSDNSRFTLVILLDDQQQWTDGHFLFRKVGEKECSYTPQQGYGVLFDNSSTEHCLESFTTLQDNVDRTILTIHEKPTP